MFQPSQPISGKAHFANTLHTSNMFVPLPDPAWTLDEAQRHELDHLRSDLRAFATVCTTMVGDDLRDGLTGFCLRIEQIVTDEASNIGVSIATALFNIAAAIDDHIFTLSMHEADDTIDLCYRAELRIAAIIHQSFAALEVTDV
jgi:hypothetical protein